MKTIGQLRKILGRPVTYGDYLTPGELRANYPEFNKVAESKLTKPKKAYPQYTGTSRK